LLWSAHDHGARIFERSAVRRVDTTRRGVTVRTRDGTVAARQVIVATGYATAAFRRLAGRFTMRHTYVLATRPVVAPRLRGRAFVAGTRDVQRYFETLFPALRDVGIAYAWEGLFANSPDGLPYIGPQRQYPRHLFALGYGGNGMTFGFLAARILLEQVNGVRSPDHRLFAFNRFR
jgi:glycine/D-amino acid oxidase-like deaminating enzyme